MEADGFVELGSTSGEDSPVECLGVYRRVVEVSDTQSADVDRRGVVYVSEDEEDAPASSRYSSGDRKLRAPVFRNRPVVDVADSQPVVADESNRLPITPKEKPLRKKMGRPAVSKKTLQNRLRAKVYREKKRAERRAADEVNRVVSARSKLTGRRRFRREVVDWVAKVGTCPSAAGARAPLAGILSHVVCEVSRFAVDFYRWRMHRYLLAKERLAWESFLRRSAVGVRVRFDETPMRLWVEDRMCRSVSVMVRCVSAFDAGGATNVLAPQLLRPFDARAPSLLGCLRINDLCPRELFGSNCRWKVLLIQVDGAAVNKKVFRSIVWQMRGAKYVLVVYSFCWSHVLSNATRWSLGSFPFGQMLRLAHVLQAKPLRSALLHCQRMMLGDSYLPNAFAEDVACSVWPVFLRCILSCNGSFGLSGESFQSLLATALELFPQGPPARGEYWITGSETSPERYAAFLERLFRRTVPVPLISRWFTVERFCWFALGLREFSLFAYMLPTGTQMTYWPGDDDVGAAPNVAMHKESVSDRMMTLMVYMDGPSFGRDLLVACISSLPRWRLARVLDSVGSNRQDGGDLGGVSSALSSMLSDTVDILAGKNPTAEFFIGRAADADVVRMHVCRAVLCTPFYLCEKNMPYTSPIWRYIRGEAPLEEVYSGQPIRQRCCADDGVSQKLFAVFDKLEDDARAASIASLEHALEGLGKLYRSAGGSSNVECESNFSIVRSLGLKQPFRAPKLSTMRRELVIKHFLISQRRWHEDARSQVEQSASVAPETVARRARGFNAFTAFMHTTQGVVSECEPFWNRLGNDTKEKWAACAKELNELVGREGAGSAAPASVSVGRGPLGSTDARCPIDIGVLHDELNGGNPELPGLWTKSAIYAWAADHDKVTPAAAFGPFDEHYAAAVVLPGEKCKTCAAITASELFGFEPFRRSVLAHFEHLRGVEVGLTVGVVFESSTSWFDVVCLLKRPLRILSCPLDIVDSVAAETGDARLPISARPVLSDIFDGRSMCILDQCRALRAGYPIAAMYPRKTGVSSGLDGWLFMYDDDCVFEALSAAGPAPSRFGETKSSRNVTMADYAALFGDDRSSKREADEDEARSDGGSICGSSDGEPRNVGVCESDDELIRKLTIREDDRIDITNRVKGEVDSTRYAVFVSSINGTVTAYWKASEKSIHMRAHKDAVRKLAKFTWAKRLTASKSSLLSMHQLDGALIRCTLWQQWHSSWVYGVEPSLLLPKSMPTPGDVAADAPRPGNVVNRHPKAPAVITESDEVDEVDDEYAFSSSEDDAQSDCESSSISSTSEGSLSF